MPVGKKLAVVLSVMITGVSVALFFRKDASPFWFWSRRSDDPFAQQVERRVGGQPTWTPPQAASQLPTATAAITQPGQAHTSPPGYPQDTRPVGSLLAPIDGVVDGADSGRYEIGTPHDAATVGADGQRRHRVEDGDTLTRLAVHYLGSADAYRQIYDLNRDVLDSPDLLPIGAELRIPARVQTGATASADPAAATGMVPLPPRPGT